MCATTECSKSRRCNSGVRRSRASMCAGFCAAPRLRHLRIDQRDWISAANESSGQLPCGIPCRQTDCKFAYIAGYLWTPIKSSVRNSISCASVAIKDRQNLMPVESAGHRVLFCPTYCLVSGPSRLCGKQMRNVRYVTLASVPRNTDRHRPESPPARENHSNARFNNDFLVSAMDSKTEMLSPFLPARPPF
jgi:hypothetical protein